MIRINNIQIENQSFLIVEFSDGTNRNIDLKPLFEKGIFKQLEDPGYFRLVKNNGYFISWPNDQELSADTLYYF